MDNAWRKTLEKILLNGCSDSDIEDFVVQNPQVNAKEIWDFVYEYDAPQNCKGCEFIQHSGTFPCTRCSRRIILRDFYKKRN